ncbi:hypothetical protein H0A36_19555 [Endozoicomonas sp. SM1973]|uniref:Uncharacterized protein n=1 Tax=Spartinivicinus marinus TaxID=2994442 RepID=A0A853I652_9GAMM|nr:hypothetical protein [Spartinivicinus marinus]MCX4027536.1 hypothetical protein [Spartinivicinus marinus]NYZ68219.1 hypothetical protein [Spartinivicinus marinus]
MQLFLFILGILCLPLMLVALANKRLATGATLLVVFFALIMSGLNSSYAFLNGLFFIPLVILIGYRCLEAFVGLSIVTKKILSVWTDPENKVDSIVNKKTLKLIFGPILIFIIVAITAAAILLLNPKLAELFI